MSHMSADIKLEPTSGTERRGGDFSDIEIPNDSTHGEQSHSSLTWRDASRSQIAPKPSTMKTTWPPKTLSEWRFVPTDPGPWPMGHARSLWDPLEAFFEEKGYRLFRFQDQEHDIPANPDEIRAPDPYHCFIGDPVPSRFHCTRNKHTAATKLSNGTHVLVQLLAIGEDGKTEVSIQNTLHRSPLSSTFPNRAVPLLDLVTYDKEQMVFGIFSLLCAGLEFGSLYSPADGFKICRQWLESVAYLHENLVAHMDIGYYEFLLNYGGPLAGPDTWGSPSRSFESLNHQWWITDFGESKIYGPDSKPEDRKVVGICAGKVTTPLIDYPKMLGPEVYLKEAQGQPYCPFKDDVYQLGKTLLACFWNLALDYPRLGDILGSMSAPKPFDRPSMPEVMASFDAYEVSLTEADLQLKGTYPYLLSTAMRLPEHIKYLRDWMQT